STRCVEPLGMPQKTSNAPLAESDTTALFVRTWPAVKLIAETLETGTPAGPRLRLPPLPGPTTVRFAAIAEAPAGIPHCPVATNERVAFAASTGPPYGPLAFLVSTRRQGGTVK